MENRVMHRLSRACRGLIGVAVAACAAAGTTASVDSGPRVAQPQSPMIPPGLGSLRQEDLSLSVTALGLTVRMMPLDEDFIRTLAPDSYRSMVGQRESKRAAIDSIARRTGLSSLTLWYVSFFNEQQGDAQFSPRDVALTNQGREFRPIDVIGLTPGFGDHRVRQRQIAAGILVFDGALNANQSLTLTIGTKSGGDWQAVLQRVEQERAKIRSRGGSTW